MCKLRIYKKGSTAPSIDPCMKELIKFIEATTGYKTLACCCGHWKYPMTIVVEKEDILSDYPFEILSATTIPRRKKFYKRDKQGYYFIPEVMNAKTK